MLLIDQQRAHQRIRFENFVRQMEAGQGTVQQLLFPESIELTPVQSSLIVAFTSELESIGFRFKHSHPNTLELDGVPAECSQSNSAWVIQEALASLEEDAETGTSARENLCWRLASSGSIRYGQMLTSPEMESLFQQLMKCQQPYYWRNQKPIIVQFEGKQLNAYFN
jgi:DNA mismatch repair protein MutL